MCPLVLLRKTLKLVLHPHSILTLPQHCVPMAHMPISCLIDAYRYRDVTIDELKRRVLVEQQLEARKD